MKKFIGISLGVPYFQALITVVSKPIAGLRKHKQVVRYYRERDWGLAIIK